MGFDKLGTIFSVDSGKTKIIVTEGGSSIPIYEWPPPGQNESFAPYLGNKHTIGGAHPLASELDLGKYYVDVLQLVLETIFLESTNHDLFNGVIFNKIPLTDLEAKTTCNTIIGATPLLDPEKLKKDVDQIRKNLECAISRFDTPNALEVSAVFGIVKMLLKVCIIEECLKNIFIFGFVRVGDIVQSDPYMTLLLDNVVNSLQSSIGQNNYESVLDYSSKIINGRIQTGESFPTPPGSPDDAEPVDGPLGPIHKLRTPEDCLKILILESANEISDIFDNRVQSIVDPEWQKKFTPYDSMDESTVQDRLIEYAISSSPKYWSPSLFPRDDTKENSAFSGLCPMHLLSTTAAGLWPLQFNGEKDSNENFEDVLDFYANTGWPNRGADNNLPWSGGYFFQPYVRINSNFDNMYLNPTPPDEVFRDSCARFWRSLKTAYDQKITETETWPDKAQNLDYFLYIGTSGRHKKIAEFIAHLFQSIEDEAKEHLGYTEPGDPVWIQGGVFEKFFKFLFCPGTENVSPGESKYFDNSLFTRLVSSYMAMPGTPSNTNPSFASDYKQGMPLNSYYYWDKEDSGATSFDQAKWSWANRGVTSTNLAVGGTLQGKNSAPLSSERYSSTIAMLGFAKELRAPSAPYASDLDITTLGQQANPDEKNALSIIGDFITSFDGYEKLTKTTDKTPAAAGGTGQNLEDYEYAKIFWYAMRNIIFDSASHLWFTFKVGMRLNLIFKIDNIASEDFEAIASKMNASAGPHEFKDYNEEKSFIWQKSENETYFCLPVESVEENAATKFKSYAHHWQWEASDDLGTAELQGPKSAAGTGTLKTPTLWAVCRAMDIALSGKNKSETLEGLKRELLKKYKGSANVGSLAMKEMVALVAIIYRQYTESAYPSINTLFGPLKRTVNRYLVQTIAAINDDYQHVDALMAETDPLAQVGDNAPSDEDLTRKFMMMCVQMAANIVDPTWQTPWLAPGPLTPVGIIAKSLATNWSEDDEDPKAQDLGAPSDYCPPDADSDYLTDIETMQAEAAAFAAQKAANEAAAQAAKNKALQDEAAKLEEWDNNRTRWIIEFLDEKEWPPPPGEGTSYNPDNLDWQYLRLNFAESELGEAAQYAAKGDKNAGHNIQETNQNIIGVRGANSNQGGPGTSNPDEEWTPGGEQIKLTLAVKHSLIDFADQHPWLDLKISSAQSSQAPYYGTNLEEIPGNGGWVQIVGGPGMHAPHGTFLTATRAKLHYECLGPECGESET
jgi:hypothetical protein